MPPFTPQPPPRRPARSRCPACGQEGAWLCENYCTEPRAYGEAPAQPPAPCSCGSTRVAVRLLWHAASLDASRGRRLHPGMTCALPHT